MSDQPNRIPTEQELSEGKLVDQDPLEPVPEIPSRLAGNNQIPDFDDDVEGTLHDPNH